MIDDTPYTKTNSFHLHMDENRPRIAFVYPYPGDGTPPRINFFGVNGWTTLGIGVAFMNLVARHDYRCSFTIESPSKILLLSEAESLYTLTPSNIDQANGTTFARLEIKMPATEIGYYHVKCRLHEEGGLEIDSRDIWFHLDVTVDIK
ncbi:TPA: hypothetical protein G5V04_003487 [Salmonella enterica]|nr:hypothetical protein [Salmonella enterica]